ncbi:hypothetical protein, conserved [Eimeria brunetti]|uniref:Derlin n=1 Tax=Eimeria brunetti TaxID=51314 RepID=U6LYI5_9EIME|nr:hypothetical protein, conserved [Eimeria brunetti]
MAAAWVGQLQQGQQRQQQQRRQQQQQQGQEQEQQQEEEYQQQHQQQQDVSAAEFLPFLYLAADHQKQQEQQQQQQAQQQTMHLQQKQQKQQQQQQQQKTLFQVYMQVPLVTRSWAAASVLLTLAAAGDSPLLQKETLCMHWGRLLRCFELWRLLTAALLQGGVSFAAASRVYAAYEAFKQLESSERQALLQQPCSNPLSLSPRRRLLLQQQQQQLLQQQRQLQRQWPDPRAFAAAAAAASGSAHLLQFLLLQCLLLAAAGGALGIPFYGTPLTAAAVYLLSKHKPYSYVQFAFGLNIPYWSFPFALAAADVLQQQQLRAAVPVLLGIATGHVYYLLKKVVPEKTGIQVLPFPSLTYRLLLQHKARAAAPAAAAAAAFSSKHL